jgi:hypothetical protein
MKLLKNIWPILLCLLVVGVGLCFVPSLLAPANEEPDFPPLSQEQLRSCPAAEPLSVRVIPKQSPTPLTKAAYHKPVADSVFDNTLFIGDSLTNGLELFGTLKNASYYCATSATAAGTLADPGLEMHLSTHYYDAVYLLLGINEMGTDPAVYAARMGQLIDLARSRQPRAHIYLQTILPVVPEKTWSERVFSVTNIQAANAALQTLAEEKNVILVDTYRAFADANGRMPDGMTSDGVHLFAKNYAIWCDYLRTHTA